MMRSSPRIATLLALAAGMGLNVGGSAMPVAKPRMPQGGVRYKRQAREPKAFRAYRKRYTHALTQWVTDRNLQRLAQRGVRA